MGNPLKLGFLIYSYFPYGGQQRDFMRLLLESLQRGHRIDVYTFRWQGEVPKKVELHLVPAIGWSRLSQYRHFTSWVRNALSNRPVDVVVGFNKMPQLDVYFAADSCFLEKALSQRGRYYRYTPRFRHFSRYEAAVFGADQPTRVLVLSDLQRQRYLQHYPECESRLIELPPGISIDRRIERRDPRQRVELRRELSLTESELLILQVGSGFRVKGVDRSLRAIASLPEHCRKRIRYVLVGQDRAARFQWLAQRLGLARQVQILPGRDDIPRFFAGADLLLHPAYEESAGYVLLEAAIAGLPVLTTATCGYATYIEQAEAGLVCPEPFCQTALNEMLLAMLNQLHRATWSENGLRFGQNPQLYSMPEVAMDHIEKSIWQKPGGEDS